MQKTSMPPLEDMHHRLRNYNRLQESLHKAMEECLRNAPTYLKLEARYGQYVQVCHIGNNDTILMKNQVLYL